MDEFELIRRYFDRPQSDDSVLVGIGDDGAVIDSGDDRTTVTVIDTLVAGVHFLPQMSAADIGYRAVAVNLSDMVAMGACPRWMTLALTLDDADGEWLEEFSSGLRDASREHAVSLVGGDTTRGPIKVVTVQVAGSVQAGLALLRSGAAVGDGVFVSGTLGDAAAGLGILQKGEPGNVQEAFLAKRFCRPSARVRLGMALSGIASAAIDVSDGLFADLVRMMAASGTGAELAIDRLPVSAELLGYAGAEKAREFALSGGDDYELCFTLPKHREADLRAVCDSGDVAVACIGEVVDGTGVSCTLDGKRFEFDHAGYRHF